MCGIFGVVNIDGAPAAAMSDAVRQGTALLRHRGPDESGVVTDGAVSFGHARLSIIDLGTGQQPMRSADGNGLICYNGEVYNFPELRAKLEKRGYRFNTHSDTEVVLNAYLEWGADCVSHLRGMFAFAAVDLKKRRVLLARDRLGIKPLHYLVKENRLYFSSELEPLYRIAGPFKMDLESLDDYLYWQYVHAPRTIYVGVRTLPPAFLVDINLNKRRHEERSYWKLSFHEDRSLGVEEWGRRLDDVMRESVKICLVSDVPYGAFLSGGIDSSIVVGYMAEILERPVRTFTIGFKNAEFSEQQYAEQVARICKTDHHMEIVEADSLKLLPLLAMHYGQPFADSSAIPTYYVSRMAGKQVKMVLSGDGGDENFAGYHSYEYIIRKLENRPERTPVSTKKTLGRLARHWYAKIKSWGDTRPLVDQAYDIHCETAKHFSPDERRRLFRREINGVVKDFHPSRRAYMEIGRQPIISRLQHLDLKAYLPFDVLTKVDVASMANSLEVRVPLLDHIVVETAACIPSEHKLRKDDRNGGTYDKKHILKNIAKKRYPADLIDRRKMGFGVPVGKWFAGELKNEVRNRLVKSEVLPKYFDMDEVAKLVEMHSDTWDCSAKLWNLLFLEEWMRGHREALS